MTRINCIPPSELTDKHLVAEYRELPRVFKLARDPKPGEYIPSYYSLGKGHVKFFYNKLLYLERRFLELVKEMQSRGFKPNYLTPPTPTPILVHLYNDWEPTLEAMSVNRARIQERLSNENSV